MNNRRHYEAILFRTSKYNGPHTLDGVMTWIDQMFDDRMRLLETNLIAKLQSGDLTDVDEAADVLVEAERMRSEEMLRIREEVVNMFDRSKG